MTTELLSTAALAARLGVQREAVRKAVRAGRLDRSRRGTRFDFALAVQEWNANRGTAANQPDTNGTIQAARHGLLEAKRQAAELDLAIKRGAYLPVALVRERLEPRIRRAAMQLRGIPSRVKQRHPETPTAVLMTMQDTIEAALAELAGGLAGGREEGAA